MLCGPFGPVVFWCRQWQRSMRPYRRGRPNTARSGGCGYGGLLVSPAPPSATAQAGEYPSAGTASTVSASTSGYAASTCDAASDAQMRLRDPIEISAPSHAAHHRRLRVLALRRSSSRAVGVRAYYFLLGRGPYQLTTAAYDGLRLDS
jgi:hypothetical protein